MRVIFETARLFALVAVFGLMAAGAGCAKPGTGGDGGSESSPEAMLGAEAGSPTNVASCTIGPDRRVPCGQPI